LRRRRDDHRFVTVVGRDRSIARRFEFAGRFEDAVAGHVLGPRCDAVARRKRGRRIDSLPGVG
jgi:hypothetical protein